jgi:hypothetical protein
MRCKTRVMGSRGISRRKTKRPSMPGSRGSAGGIRTGPGPLRETATPAVMWPETGFEASATSPAGEIQGVSRLAAGMRGLKGQKPAMAATLAAIVIIGFLVSVIVVLLVTH